MTVYNYMNEQNFSLGNIKYKLSGALFSHDAGQSMKDDSWQVQK